MASASGCNGTTCTFFCLVVAAGLIQSLRAASIWSAVRPMASPMRQPVSNASRNASAAERLLSPLKAACAAAISSASRKTWRWFSGRRRMPRHGLPVNLVVVLEPRHERGQNTERAVGVDWRVLGHLAVPDLDAVAGDRPWLVPAEGGQDVAVDHVTVAIGGAGPAA